MSAEVERLPVLVFDEPSIPAEHQFDVFHDTTAPLFDTRLLAGGAPIHAGATDYLVDDLVVSRLQYGPQAFRRTRRHTAVAGDCVAVQLYYQGGLRGRIGDDCTLEIDPRHVAIVDLAHPFTCWSDDSDVIWVTIPRARLGTAMPSGRVGIVKYHQQSPRGRILTAAVEHLWGDAMTARRAQAPLLAARIIDAVGAVLRPGDFAPGDDSLSLAMKDHVKANLADLSLGADSLRSTFYCSRSSLYRLFQADGGVAAYMRDQRLLRCFDELTQPATADTSIFTIATRWGFENPSHFNRLFKAKFGFPPSVVATHHRDLSTPRRRPHFASAQIVAFHAWAAAL